ncbi:TM2 domain-containing protein [Eoetvoesiella caeni]|uniref:TM2 domain-containing protein n=1 Tax=Eoetvoesiella caeni TaxID=645616 RepID=A0A366HL85_9BURK|nr:TM2 domain-containing protein [Eoetvoesiella caeni]MCI2807260.1 TM2 domain-containing protein [Eoetvoesiella caeni]NYT53345.1 TM2 domain-containing protein [Eoetvoesiella caeni]RBP43327.1 TM2 domain-containing protein [Eoetvoesiella caeni]
MLQKIILPIAVFLVVLAALTFGETISQEVLRWFTYLTGIVVHNFADVYYTLRYYFAAHLNKVIIALILTVPISIWLIRNKGQNLAKRTSQRKIAIVLAIFLGWLGGHRFYLGQIGWGIFYLVLFYVFTPLVIILSLIDAIRYLFMSEEDFQPAKP